MNKRCTLLAILSLSFLSMSGCLGVETGNPLDFFPSANPPPPASVCEGSCRAGTIDKKFGDNGYIIGESETSDRSGGISVQRANRMAVMADGRFIVAEHFSSFYNTRDQYLGLVKISFYLESGKLDIQKEGMDRPGQKDIFFQSRVYFSLFNLLDIKTDSQGRIYLLAEAQMKRTLMSDQYCFSVRDPVTQEEVDRRTGEKCVTRSAGVIKRILPDGSEDLSFARKSEMLFMEMHPQILTLDMQGRILVAGERMGALRYLVLKDDVYEPRAADMISFVPESGLIASVEGCHVLVAEDKEKFQFVVKIRAAETIKSTAVSVIRLVEGGVPDPDFVTSMFEPREFEFVEQTLLGGDGTLYIVVTEQLSGETVRSSVNAIGATGGAALWFGNGEGGVLSLGNVIGLQLRFQSDGKFVLAGWSNPTKAQWGPLANQSRPGSSVLLVSRVSADGKTPDTDFGTNGFAFVRFDEKQLFSYRKDSLELEITNGQLLIRSTFDHLGGWKSYPAPYLSHPLGTPMTGMTRLFL